MSGVIEPPLRGIKLDDFLDREHIALRELERYGFMMLNMPQIVRAKGYACVWHWLIEWHPYLLMREPSRFGDEQFYLVDRGYNPWRRHMIAFARDELLDCDDFKAWQHRIKALSYDDVFAVMDDAMEHRMRNKAVFSQYANMIFGLVRRLEERYQDSKKNRAQAMKAGIYA